jgi:excisionase family DNA binding protein
MTAPLLYTLAEAAELLQVTENWLKVNVSANAIPHRRVGRAIRFNRDDLDLLVEQCAKTRVKAKTRRSA